MPPFSSEWVKFRESVKDFFTEAFHDTIDFLKPVVFAVASSAGPVVQQAAVNAAIAVKKAADEGTAHGTHEMIDVGLKSLRESAPHLQATVATTIVASVVQKATEAAKQAANDLGTSGELSAVNSPETPNPEGT